MLKSRDQLESYLENKIVNIGLNKTEMDTAVGELCLRHNINKVRSTNIFSHRVSLQEVTEFELFCLLQYVRESRLDEFFTKSEIDNWANYGLVDEDSNVFPIVIKCVQIEPDQYIGKADVNFFMNLRNHQLINYNAAAQRTMQRMVRGNFEYYKISVNQTAVKQIVESYNNNAFIPNTITLNIPINETSKWYYDDKNCELVIESLDAFDISDGYHRYVAMSRLKDSNPDWNYPMEIRIISFDNDRTRNFIFQEDQKTKMRKVDSNSMNMNSNANIVVDRINQDSRFDLKGEIGRNGGLISFGELAGLIDYFYFKRKTLDKPAGLVRATIQKDFVDRFNELVETDQNLFAKRFDFKELCIIMYGFFHKFETTTILAALNNASELSNSKFTNKTPRKTLFTDIDTLYTK